MLEKLRYVNGDVRGLRRRMTAEVSSSSARAMRSGLLSCACSCANAGAATSTSRPARSSATSPTLRWRRPTTPTPQLQRAKQCESLTRDTESLVGRLFNSGGALDCVPKAAEMVGCLFVFVHPSRALRLSFDARAFLP